MTTKHKIYQGKVLKNEVPYLTFISPDRKAHICIYDYKYGKRSKEVFRGDVIAGEGVIGDDGILIFINEPLVIVGTDEITVLNFIKNCASYLHPNDEMELTILPTRVKMKYPKIEMCDFLNSLCDSYAPTGSHSVFKYPLDNFINDNVKNVLVDHWTSKYMERKLNLLGITRGELKEETEYETLTQIYEKAIKNPYLVLSVSLIKADSIYELLRRTPTIEQKICGMIARKLKGYLRDYGHSCIPYSEFVSIGIDNFMTSLVEDFGVVKDLDHLYLPYPYTVESNVARHLKKCAQLPAIIGPGYKPVFTREDLDDEQRSAVMGVLKHPVSAITGGAGTGKTTIIREVVHNLKKLGIQPLVTSFTGKAVSRLKKIVSSSKKTRTLDSHIIGVAQPFQFVIIDEASMVSTELFYRFIKRYENSCRLLFVGDVNQLPPISWGSMFRQIRDSDKIQFFKLEKNHRTVVGGDTNGIVDNATKLIDFHKGLIKNFAFTKYGNFKMTHGGEKELIQCVSMFKTHYGNETFNETALKVISPFNGPLDTINRNIRELMLPGAKYIVDAAGKRWYQGSVVMMIKNNREVGIMNGDEGVVTAIDYYNKKITVKFYNGIIGDFYIKKERKKNLFGDQRLDTSLLINSYAITVHKSQGSEWDIILLYIPKTINNNNFVNFNLLYTAITRARKLIWCIGDPGALNEFAKIGLAQRYENLGKRL